MDLNNEKLYTILKLYITTIDPGKISKKYLQVYNQVVVKISFEFYINPGLSNWLLGHAFAQKGGNILPWRCKCHDVDDEISELMAKFQSF